MYLRVLQILGAEISARYAAGGFVRSGAGLGYLAGCNGENFAPAGAEAESEGGRVGSKTAAHCRSGEQRDAVKYKRRAVCYER